MIVQGRFLLLRNDIVLITVALLTCNIVNAAEELEYVDYSDVDDYSNKSCICVPYYKCRAIREDGAGLISIRLTGNRECRNYLEVCCENVVENASPPTKNTVDPLINDSIKSKTTIANGPPVREGSDILFEPPGNANFVGCGLRKIRVATNLADSSGDALYGEFPWMALIMKKITNGEKYKKVPKCGGALIHPRAVLTAAHCVEEQTITYIIRVGEFNLSGKGEVLPHQDREVDKLIFHPKADIRRSLNNIAILLFEPILITRYVDIVCLPPQGTTFTQSNCYVSGWGPHIFRNASDNNRIIRKIDLPIVERRKCQNDLRETRLGMFFQLHESLICAGGISGKDTCQGDGGSPLVCPIQTPNGLNRYVLAGLVAWGIDCGTATPATYINVALFRDWIDQTLQKEGLLETDFYSY